VTPNWPMKRTLDCIRLSLPLKSPGLKRRLSRRSASLSLRENQLNREEID